MKIEGDKIIFSTGKESSANGGVIGLAPDGGITDGWDGTLYSKEYAGDGFDGDLEPKERMELAKYMIKEWTKVQLMAFHELNGLVNK